MSKVVYLAPKRSEAQREDRTRVNVMAAKLVGWKEPKVEGSLVIVGNARVFDLFTYAADCLAVVKALGNDYGVGIDPHYSDKTWRARLILEDDYNKEYDTFEQAVAAAVKTTSLWL